jgi:uncharacterized protein (TIGR02594 family)
MANPSESLGSLSGTSMSGGAELIRKYLKDGGVGLNPAEKAWCAAAVNSSLAQSGYKGTGSDMARSFLNWGEATEAPKVGDLAVFSRGDPKGPYGHVGYFQGYDEKGNIKVLGGNQGGGVNVSSYPKDRLLGFRSVGDPTEGYDYAKPSPVGYGPIQGTQAGVSGVTLPQGVAGPMQTASMSMLPQTGSMSFAAMPQGLLDQSKPQVQMAQIQPQAPTQIANAAGDFDFTKLASGGLGLMAAGAPKSTAAPALGGQIHRPQMNPQLFAGLLRKPWDV